MLEPATLERARSYLGLGWSIIPFAPRDKMPHSKLLPLAYNAEEGRDKATWKHYQAAPPAMADVRRWCKADPELNIGIVTGRVSGLLLADADGPMAREWMEEQGAPHTPTAATSPGKRHYYFQYPPDGGRPYGNRTELLVFPDGSQLDIRAEGGLATAPGSTHPDGHLYEWVITPEEAKPAPVPARLLSLLRPAATPTVITTTATRKEDLSERAAKRRAAYVEKAIDGELRELAAAAAPQGAGNHTLFKVTARLYGFVASGDAQESDIERAIEQAAAAYIARDGRREFENTFNSGRRSGLAEPATFPNFDDDGPLPEPVKLLPTGGDGATSLLERYQQLEMTLWNVITADAKDGWDTSAKVLAAYGVLELFRQEADTVAINGGAAAVAPHVGMSKQTVGTHAERLEQAGLWQWHRGQPVLHDKKRQPVSRTHVDPTRTLQAQGLHYETESILYFTPLPTDSLPILPRTKRQETQKQREEEKRQQAEETRQEAEQRRREVLELRETLEKLEAARCPHCEAQSTLGAHCNDCGAIVSAEELAGKSFTDPDPEPAQAESSAPAPTDPGKTLDSIKLRPNIGRQAPHSSPDKQQSEELPVCVQTFTPDDLLGARRERAGADLRG
jgi:hypothetical protein